MNQPPPGAPTPEQLAYLDKFVRQGVPLDAPGVIYWPDKGAFYVVGKHSLMVKPWVIKVPFALWAAAFGQLLGAAVVPMLTGLRPGLVQEAAENSDVPTLDETSGPTLVAD
jgi:hypothetical protein